MVDVVYEKISMNTYNVCREANKGFERRLIYTIAISVMLMIGLMPTINGQAFSERIPIGKCYILISIKS